MEQRSVLSELVLVVIVLVFVVLCATIISALHRGLPQPSSLATAATPQATGTPRATATRVSLVAAAAPTSTPQPTAVASAAATPTPSRGQYAAVTGAQLDGQADAYVGKKVTIAGSVFYVRRDGENDWVQILTSDGRYFIDVNFSGTTSVKKDDQVKVYGTADGKTTIRANDGKDYVQPYINPGDFIDKS